MQPHGTNRKDDRWIWVNYYYYYYYYYFLRSFNYYHYFSYFLILFFNTCYINFSGLLIYFLHTLIFLSLLTSLVTLFIYLFIIIIIITTLSSGRFSLAFHLQSQLHRRYSNCWRQNSGRYHRIIRQTEENKSFLESYQGYRSNFGFCVPFGWEIGQI